MGLIIIVRHGHSESNLKEHLTHDIEGYPLTLEGKKYLIKSATELRKIKNIKKLISSPVLRARQTAEIISDVTGLKVHIDDRLAERRMGKYNNKIIPSSSKAAKRKPDWHINEILNSYPNGFESWESLTQRVESLLKEIPKDRNVILVSHGDPIKAIIAYFLGLDEFGTWGIRVNHGHFTIIDSKKRKLIAIGAPILSESILNRLES